ncbi:pirin family protein [Paenibacillus psychroresistens]|uniref:Pirin family protein n=1 Tax=Paenibacillus psychroresistens TaxID=1778678 RepID=A0A6B8RLR5_9BACL|nr:pirin family protein [Paenibacillus psychroresistens]QGQ97250.1 pirin family protein [Paenibacillus psychroresistens]
MIEVFPAESRYQKDLGWLKVKLSFSFGDYFDPNNTAFGVMRVCNDDEVAAGLGFGPHPHSDMEIVTVVLAGAVRHEDNLGNIKVTSVGEVQRMTAGSGIIHAEYNDSATEKLHALQLWFMPNELGLKPSFEISGYDLADLHNALLPILDPIGSEHTVKIHQDMTLYLSRLDKGKELSFQQAEGRRIFIFTIEGSLTVNESKLDEGDTARIESQSHLSIRAEEAAFLMLIDLP